MSKFGYTVEYKIETMARAYGRELPLAWKKSVELARQLRGKTVDQAREYLEKVIALKQPVPMKKYKRWVAHKAGPGPARYPVNAGHGPGRAPGPDDRSERRRDQGPHGSGRTTVPVRQPSDRSPGGREPRAERTDHGRKAGQRPRTRLALPARGSLDRAADHGGRCKGVPRRDRRQADRPAASDGEIQGGPHQVLRRAAEPLDGPRLRVREVEARDHRRHGRNHGSAGEAARRGGDQEADGRIPRRRSGRGARTDSGTGARGRGRGRTRRRRIRRRAGTAHRPRGAG